MRRGDSIVPDHTAKDMAALHNRGESLRAIAREYGVDKETVGDAIRRLKDPPATKILVVDIETMANLGWHWGTWQQNIYPAQIVKHKRTISFAAKWVGERKVKFYSEFHDGREEMVRAAWELLNEADAVIGYNSKRFDVKHLNTEFVLLGYPPPTHFQHIDLLQVTKREFAFGSNKLESVATRMALGKKREHEGFALWTKCEAGDAKAWGRMRAYNVQDVKLTERLFEDFRAWVPLRGSQSQKRLREVLAA
jgi:DNA polymerase elongation subunit (family B)